MDVKEKMRDLAGIVSTFVKTKNKIPLRCFGTLLGRLFHEHNLDSFQNHH